MGKEKGPTSQPATPSGGGGEGEKSRIRFRRAQTGAASRRF